MAAAEVDQIVSDSERTYMMAARDLRDLPPQTAITVRFEDLTTSPAKVLDLVYRQLELPGDPAPLPERREDASEGHHSYALTEFGLSEADIRHRLSPIMNLYGF